jgi:outer membrane protein assembly factor BamB
MGWGLATSGRSLVHGILVAGLMAALAPMAALAGTDITTYHGDAFRTGWNSTETRLTPREVAGKAFGLLRTLDLDDQVDAQPLVVSDQPIEGRTSISDVVYAVTETNSVYAFDTATGEQLLHVNLGTPVPRSLLPGGCLNNGQTIGIASTPVIDPARETMYLVAYTLEDGAPVYRMHALDLRNLRDRVVPAPIIKSVVNASSDPVRFDAAANRQRAGLVLANGNVYATFASFCDLKTSASRGWVMGWQQNTLKPIPARPFVDRKAAGSAAWYLSSIWMSGAAPAVDATGRLYVVTGNRILGPTGAPPGEREMSESVAAISGDLRLVSEYFTPHNRDELDAGDMDFGSGGVMVLPEQEGPVPRLATAAGKDGTLYLLDRDHMGGFTPNGPDKVVGKYAIGGCFCVQSYFVGQDGTPRIVTSGGTTIMVWKIVTSPSSVRLEREIASHPLLSGQFPGFMTAVSSNGTENAVIWAVSHPPNDGPRTISLHAFDATTATRLFSQAAGTWPNFDGTANVMPVVANGKVFVAAYRSLSIFGLRVPSKNLVSLSPNETPAIALPVSPAAAHKLVARAGN